MSLLNKFFSARGGSASGGKKTEKKKPIERKTSPVKMKETKPAAETAKTEISGKSVNFKRGGILVSPLTTEKAVAGQSLNKYVFKVVSSANKIEVAKAVGKNYNVKAVSVNIINIPQKARRVGKTRGFKSGFKKAIVTLEKGQSIEIK